MARQQLAALVSSDVSVRLAAALRAGSRPLPEYVEAVVLGGDRAGWYLWDRLSGNGRVAPRRSYGPDRGSDYRLARPT